MQKVTFQIRSTVLPRTPLLIAAAIVAVLILSGLALRGAAGSRWPGASPAVQTISQQTLEKTYGLEVKLAAVTAAGGMVDVRLRILDQEKAKVLLGNKASFPVLRVEGSSSVLYPPEDSVALGENLKSDQLLMLLYPNANTLVKTGSLVSVFFGNIRLEPIEVQ